MQLEKCLQKSCIIWENSQGTLLGQFFVKKMKLKHWYQDPSQDPHLCGGPAKGQQSQKLLPSG
jgi:hypothetical protein